MAFPKSMAKGKDKKEDRGKPPRKASRKPKR